MALLPEERRYLRLLAAVQFLAFLDFELLMPMGPFLGPELGIQTAELGRLVSVYTFGAMAGALLYGRYADRWSKRTALITSMAILALATLACGLAQKPWHLLAARAVAGFMAGPAGAAVMALAADLVPEERRGEALGVVMSGYTVASVLGLPVAVYTAGRLGWRPPFLALAAIAACVLFLAWRSLPAKAPQERLEAGPPPWVPPATPAMAWAWAGAAVMVVADFCFVPFLPSLFTGNLGLSKEALGWCYFAGGLTTLVTFRVSGRLSDRFGSFPVVAVASALAALAVGTAFSGLHGPISVGAGMALMAFIFFANAPRVLSAFALFSKAPDPEHQGLHQSFLAVIQYGVIGATSWGVSVLVAGGEPGSLAHTDRLLAIYGTALVLALPILWILEQKTIRSYDGDPKPLLQKVEEKGRAQYSAGK